jgi:hypothetical protein
MLRSLVFVPFIALMAACSTPTDTLEGADLGGLAPVAEAGQLGPDAPDAEIVVAAQTPVEPDVAADANVLFQNCSQAWESYERAQVAIRTDAKDPQALAAKQAGTALASAAVAQGARAGADLVGFLAEHPEAVNLARAQAPQTPWPSSFYDCFGRPTEATPASAPSPNSASSATTASTTPQPAGPSVSN